MTATNLSVQVHNASFSGYGVNGNGGALLLSATDHANITVTNSSFEDTSSFGGFQRWSYSFRVLAIYSET